MIVVLLIVVLMPAGVGPKDTKPQDVYEVTYEGYVPKLYKKKGPAESTS